ncbi:MAG: hypothetical protein Q9221_009173, partial [Calogaya cf. arnoldii]
KYPKFDPPSHSASSDHVTFTRSDYGDEGDERELAMWAPLFYLPSMRSIRAEYVRAGEDTFHYPGRCWGIEELVFQDLEVNLTSLDSYLKDIKNLRHFQWNEHTCSTGSQRIIPRSIAQKLLEYASHSLQYLEMSNTTYSAQSRRFLVGSLKGFLNLKTIYLEGFLLIEDAHTRLSDMLPRSTVHVRLLPTCFPEVFGVDSRLAPAILRNSLVNIAELLPNFNRFEILCGVNLHKIKGTTIIKECREAGLEISDQHEVLN